MKTDFSKLTDRINNVHGEARTEKQHTSGKMTAWERINTLLDPESFVETNVFVEHRCNYFGMENKRNEGDGVITGFGKINGRTVCIYAQDFTILGGSISEMNAHKISDIQKKALKMKVPIIGLIDSSGARIQEGIQSLSGHGYIFFNNVQASGKIPQISAIMGSCAGGASYSPALTDFIIMVRKNGSMFITGPKVVKEAIGEEVTIEELGGPEIHAKKSGLTDIIVEDDIQCLDNIKKLLDYLPNNCYELPGRSRDFRHNRSLQDKLASAIPSSNHEAFNVKKVIEAICDEGSEYELKPEYAPNIITMFSKIAGYPVGIVANQSTTLAGAIDTHAADKASRFIRICDSFNIPIITLVDVPGFLPGTEQEHKGIIKHGAKMLYAYSEAAVAKITIILRKGYGGAYLAMCSKELGADLVYAWPEAEIAVMGAKAAVNVIYRNESPATKNEKLEDYCRKFLSPDEAVHMGYVDEIITPEMTREKIVKALELCYRNSDLSLTKNIHGNIPL